MTIVIILIVSINSSSIEPRVVINHFKDKMIALINLIQKLCHCTSRIDWIFYPCLKDFQKIFRLFQDISKTPFRSSIKLHLNSLFEFFIYIIEVSLSIFIIDIRNWLEMFNIMSSQIHLAVFGQIYLQVFDNMLIHCFEFIQPLYDVLFDDEEAIIHFLWGCLEILGPFNGVGDADNNPIVFEREHCCVCQDH